MKVYSIEIENVIRSGKSGIAPATAHGVITPKGRYYAVTHGQEGRGRWQIRIPLAVRDFPWIEGRHSLSLDGIDLELVDLKRKDARGNPMYLLTRAAEDDGRQIVLWHLDPGYRGSATYKVAGKAKVIALGHEAQGDAGRMGGADCPVLLVEGPCVLTWRRTGRLYGEPSDWVAEYDGERWVVAPADQCAVDEIALTY